MEIKLKPFVPNGEINPPSSKSYCHRYLICAFIANKPFTIYNFNFCDDTIATLNGLKELGGLFEFENNTVKFIKRTALDKKIIIDTKASASTLRMLLPIACCLYDDVTFVGEESLFLRPLDVYEDILKTNKIPYDKTEKSIHIKKKLRATKFSFKGDVSSQFVTGLMFYSLLSDKDVLLDLTTPLVSSGYVTMTIDVLNEFGESIKHSKESEYEVKGNNALLEEKFIETDYSSVSYFAILGALKGGVKINYLNLNSFQPDLRIFSLLKNMGAKFEVIGDSVTFQKADLCCFNVDISNSIDLGPTLFVLASLVKGQSIITGVNRLIIKETNRLKAMIDELSFAGVDISLSNDTIIINGKQSYEGKVIFNTYGDHRIAMALSIFSIVSGVEATIENIECVTKSYPNFFKDLEGLNK